jgi:predicted DNA binding CopG/RHH family protein
MKQPKQKLNSEEQEILSAFEAGKLKSVSNIKTEKKRLQNLAKAHGLKNRRVSLRMSEWDFTRIQEEALKEGLPYQSLLSSIIHKYLTGQFQDLRRK